MTRSFVRNTTQPLVLQGTRAPVATDDRAHGLVIGTFWLDLAVDPPVLYISTDDTPTAAVWSEVGGGGGGGLVYVGTWSSVTTYAANDVVSYNGGSYVALQSNTNVTPTSLAPNWNVLASPGLTQATANTLYRNIDSYVFTQASPSATWVINHGLGTDPGVTVIVGGQQILPGVVYNTSSQLTLTFNTAYSGTAILT
jgi:hypothetical protein